MRGRVTDTKEVGDTPGRRDTAVGTTGLGIILPIFAVVINTCHFSIKSWPQMKGKQCRDEEELKGSNSAPSQAVLICEASTLRPGDVCVPPLSSGCSPGQSPGEECVDTHCPLCIHRRGTVGLRLSAACRPISENHDPWDKMPQPLGTNPRKALPQTWGS